MTLKLLQKLRRGSYSPSEETAQPSDNSCSISKKPFDVPELLEKILLYLRPPDLRHARLVSRTWHAVVAASPSLKKEWTRKVAFSKVKYCFISEIDISRVLAIADFYNVIKVHPFEDQMRNAVELSVGSLRVEISLLTTHWQRLVEFMGLLDRYQPNYFVMVYNYDDRTSFDRMRRLRREIAVTAHLSPRFAGILALKSGNRDRPRAVTEAEGRQLASDLRCELFEADVGDSDNSIGLQKMFEAMISRHIDSNFFPPKELPDARTLAEYPKGRPKPQVSRYQYIIRSISGRPR